jgi:hypothetical protein
VHLLNFLIAFLFARSLGIGVSYGEILMIMPVILVVVLLPITVNGHGLRELLLIGYFSALGLSQSGNVDAGVRELAVAFSLLLVGNDFLWTLPGGLGYFAWLRSTTAPAQRAAAPITP